MVRWWKRHGTNVGGEEKERDEIERANKFVCARVVGGDNVEKPR